MCISFDHNDNHPFDLTQIPTPSVLKQKDLSGAGSECDRMVGFLFINFISFSFFFLLFTILREVENSKLHLSLLLQKQCDDNHLLFFHFGDRYYQHTEIEFSFRHLSVPKNECITQNKQYNGNIYNLFLLYKETKKECMYLTMS